MSMWCEVTRSLVFVTITLACFRPLDENQTRIDAMESAEARARMLQLWVALSSNSNSRDTSANASTSAFSILTTQRCVARQAASTNNEHADDAVCLARD